MEFKTKFDLEEHAWYIKDNRPTEVVISAIEIFFVGTNQNRIKYSAKNIANSISWLDHQNLFEANLFKSKKALFDSLFGATFCKGKNCSAENGVGHSADCIKEHEQLCAGA